MQEAINKAAALVEAGKYIHQFAGKRVVVKVGGSIMDQPEDLKSLVEDVCFMAAVGIRPIIVHGGGKSINAAMAQAGLESQFVQGRRYTDERTLAIAEHVLVNEVNKNILQTIVACGHKAVGLHTLASCVVFGKRLFLLGEEGRKIDIGMVGEVDWVNTQLLEAVCDAGYIPVIAPIARDRTGAKLNINADSVAGGVAAALKCEKLLLVSDTPGIRKSDNPTDWATHLTRAQIDQLVETKVIATGMLPKVEASIMALEAGVKKTHIIDGRLKHALLLEVYTTAGVGTEIVL